MTDVQKPPEQPEQSEQPEPATADTPTSDNAQPRLELIDLINCRLCLQLMTRRGAVLPSEMEGFGKVYNNINTFLKQMAPGSISLEDPSTIPPDGKVDGTAVPGVGTSAPDVDSTAPGVGTSVSL